MRTNLALALATALAAIAAAGCGEPPAPRPENVNAPVAVNSNAMPGPAPATKAGEIKPPLEMKDSVEGRVVGLLCYREKPSAPAAEAIACAKTAVVEGGYLAVLADDGTVYVNEKEVQSNNAQLQPFIGETVTVQGVMIGDAPNLNWGNVKVKKFDMKMVRRKGPPLPGKEKDMVPRNQNRPR